MYEIKIVEPCGCAKKRKAWNQDLKFETIEEARQKAKELLLQGNERFCKKHSFTLEESDNIIEIIKKPRKK
jgi:hypothetical protein